MGDGKTITEYHKDQVVFSQGDNERAMVSRNLDSEIGRGVVTAIEGVSNDQKEEGKEDH